MFLEETQPKASAFTLCFTIISTLPHGDGGDPGRAGVPVHMRTRSPGTLVTWPGALPGAGNDQN
jgi:hypothetical protein